MVYLGKRNYVPSDCCLAMACKEHNSKYADVCDLFARNFCEYVNNNGVLSALLEVGLEIERKVLIKLRKQRAPSTIYKYIYSLIRHGVSDDEALDIDTFFLFYLYGLESLKKFRDRRRLYVYDL